MRFSYLLYPEALKKIKESGIEQRVDKLISSKDGLGFINDFISTEEVTGAIQNLRERRFYDHLPADFSRKYWEVINNMVNCPERYNWIVNRQERKVAEPCDLCDMQLFSGDLASLVLNPKELWDYARFGFSSSSAFVTTVGAFIFQKSRGSLLYGKGYSWTRTLKDGTEIVSEISGDVNCDLRIYQNDITSYPTIDPFGQQIELRPEQDIDRITVAPYHSTESTLFVVVMRYIEQQKINTEFLDKAKLLVNVHQLLRELSPNFGFGTCAEHFGGFDRDSRLFFTGYEHPIPTLNQANQSSEYSNFWLPTSGEGGYKIYITHNGDLVLSPEPSNQVEDLVNVKPIGMRFPPEDAEHLLKGLIYQAAKNLGRTSVRQLLSILKYRYSQYLRRIIRFLGYTLFLLFP